MSRKIVILTEGYTDPHRAKTAISLLRYRPEEVIAVLDKHSAGKSCHEMLGVGGDLKIVASLVEVPSADTLLLGIAPPGGRLPAQWRPIILEAIARPLLLEGKSVSVSASLGITLFPKDDADPDTLLRHADQAMYQAKQEGKNRYHIYDPEHDRQLKVQRETLARLSQALEQGEFEMYYQPKVNLGDGRVSGVEALLRWHHPQRGLLAPGTFLFALEESGLITPLSHWLVDQTVATPGPRHLTVAPRRCAISGAIGGFGGLRTEGVGASVGGRGQERARDRGCCGQG